MPARIALRPVALAVAACGALLCATPPAMAESIGSMAASSVSSAGSKSAGSASDSLQGSSTSSSGGAQVTDGPYQVLAVAEAAGRAGHITLHLRPATPTEGAGEGPARTDTPATTPTTGAADLWLTVPRATLADAPVAAGDRLIARVRPHGVAFARAATAAEPFFLALTDVAARDLAARAVSL